MVKALEPPANREVARPERPIGPVLPSRPPEPFPR